MSKIKDFFVMDFTIFSVLVLIQSFLHQIGIVEDFHSHVTLQYFILSSILAGMELLIDLILRITSTILRMLASIVNALIWVYCLGGLVFQWFPFNLKWILITVGLTVVITTVLFFVTGIFSARQAAEQINRIITRKKYYEGHMDNENR